MQNNIVGIFVFYDRDKIVDKYILHLVDSLKIYCKKMIIISNGHLDENNRILLEQRADYYFERDNRGYDFGAWKEIFIYKFSREFWTNYSVALCFNDTFYGPIFSLDDIFKSLDNSNADLWGLTRFGSVKFEGRCVFPFIQTYFWAVKTNLLHSNYFFEFWEDINENETSFDEIQKYEILLSQYIQEGGYKIGTYIDTEDYEVNELGIDSGREVNRALDKFELPLLINRGFPFVKRKNFFYSRNSINEVKMATDLKRVMNYVSTNTNFDTDMIFENIIRLKGAQIVKQSLNHNYVLNDKICESSSINNKIKIVALKTCANENILNRYIDKINIDNFIIINHLQKTNNNLEMNYCLWNNLYDLLDQQTDKVDYICILGEFSRLIKNKIAYTSYQEMLYDNLILSRDYIDNIINILEKSEYFAAIQPIIKINTNNKYVTGYEPVGIWVKSKILKEYLNDKPLLIFRYNLRVAINEFIFDLTAYITKKGYLIPGVIFDEYASILITEFLLQNKVNL